jgi:hypothetical protein
MNQKTTTSEQTSDARRAYEPPAIEESAGFERLALFCNMTLPEQDEGGCLPVANSSM